MKPRHRIKFDCRVTLEMSSHVHGSSSGAFNLSYYKSLDERLDRYYVSYKPIIFHVSCLCSCK